MVRRRPLLSAAAMSRACHERPQALPHGSCDPQPRAHHGPGDQRPRAPEGSVGHVAHARLPAWRPANACLAATLAAGALAARVLLLLLLLLPSCPRAFTRECPRELLIVSGPEPCETNSKQHHNNAHCEPHYSTIGRSPTTYIVLRPRSTLAKYTHISFDAPIALPAATPRTSHARPHATTRAATPRRVYNTLYIAPVARPAAPESCSAASVAEPADALHTRSTPQPTPHSDTPDLPPRRSLQRPVRPHSPFAPRPARTLPSRTQPSMQPRPKPTASSNRNLRAEPRDCVRTSPRPPTRGRGSPAPRKGSGAKTPLQPPTGGRGSLAPRKGPGTQRPKRANQPRPSRPLLARKGSMWGGCRLGSGVCGAVGMSVVR